MKIEIPEYYFDGKRTCSRWFGDEKTDPQICPMLLSSHFGHIFHCRLFAVEIGGKHCDSLGFYENMLIKPHDTCISMSENVVDDSLEVELVDRSCEKYEAKNS